MNVKIKCKDTTTPVYYEKVLSHFLEGPTLALLFEDGKVRNFPLQHIWYYETEQPREKTQVESEVNKIKGRFLLRIVGALTDIPFGTEREFNLIRRSEEESIVIGDKLYLKDNTEIEFLVTGVEALSYNNVNVTLKYIGDEKAYCPGDYLEGPTQFIEF